MPLIALTGGIASGKSTIARRLAEHGAVIVDADQIVRDVQAPGSPVLERIAEVARTLEPDPSKSVAEAGSKTICSCGCGGSKIKVLENGTEVHEG